MKFIRYNEIIMSASGIFGFALTIFLGANQMGIWFVISLICLALLILGYIIYGFIHILKNKSKLYSFINYHSSSTNLFRVLKHEAIYEFKDRTHIKYEKRTKLKSNIDNLHEFTDRYKWSKDGECNVEACVPGQKINTEHVDPHWNYCSITLDKYYKKGQECDTGIILPNLVDNKKESLTFLSTGIFDPTKELILRVRIHNSLEIESAKILFYKSYFDLSETLSDDIEPKYGGSKYSELVYSCTYPLVGAKYVIKWSFKEGDNGDNNTQNTNN